MIETFFNPEIIGAIWPIVVAGLLNTVLLSLIVVPLGLLGGLILALLATLHHPLVRWPLMAWVDFFRAFPPQSNHFLQVFFEHKFSPAFLLFDLCSGKSG